MRKYDIPYVPNAPADYYPAKALEDMTLEEVVKKYIKTCGKANGSVAICSQCKSPCKEGKRAIQLLSNKVYNDPPIPLYGGKTLIEKAREENLKRRENSNMSALAKALEEAQKKEQPQKRKYVKLENWWEDSLASGDQIKWLMDHLKISKTQARKKVYQYKFNHGMAGSQKKESPQVETMEIAKEEVLTETKPVNDSIESKLESLMKLQELHKKAMDEYMKLYEQAKAEYEAIKQKTDILCSAMDILND